jgi:hypothetical protein
VLGVLYRAPAQHDLNAVEELPVDDRGCTIFPDQTHLSDPFQRSLVVWLSATSSTSMSTSSLRCVFQTWWLVGIPAPGTASKAAETMCQQLAITAVDIAEVIAFAVTRPRRMTLNEILVRPKAQP